MTEAEDQNTQPQSPVDTTELITEVTSKVKRVISLREEVTTLVAEIREGQRILGAAGIGLNFPVLDSVDAPPPSVSPPVGGQQIASSITPVVPEIIMEEGEYTGGSGPSLDDGSAKQIANDSAAPATPQDESMFQESIVENFDAAVAGGYAKGKIFTQ